MREESVFLEGPDGVLEALYLGNGTQGAALLCHPHSMFGGTLHNKVVTTMQRAARDEGYATLRFNFRGVGGSAGEYDQGIGEIDDAQAAAQWLMSHRAMPLTLMGFSFGACVAANLAARLEREGLELAHLYMLAPPLVRFSVELPQRCPLTVIQPMQDEVVEPETVYLWSDGLEKAHELIRVPESSHFFHGKLIELKDILRSRLRLGNES